MVDRIDIAVPSGVDLYSGPSPDSDSVRTNEILKDVDFIFKEQSPDIGAAVMRIAEGTRYRHLAEARTAEFEELVRLAISKKSLTLEEENVIRQKLETLLF